MIVDMRRIFKAAAATVAVFAVLVALAMVAWWMRTWPYKDALTMALVGGGIFWAFYLYFDKPGDDK